MAENEKGGKEHADLPSQGLLKDAMESSTDDVDTVSAERSGLKNGQEENEAGGTTESSQDVHESSVQKARQKFSGTLTLPPRQQLQRHQEHEGEGRQCFAPLQQLESVAEHCLSIVMGHWEFVGQNSNAWIRGIEDKIYRLKKLDHTSRQKAFQLLGQLKKWEYNLRHRISFAEYFTARGVVYLGCGSHEKEQRVLRDSAEVYIFYFNFKNRNAAKKDWQTFDILLQFAEQEGYPCVMVDLEVRNPGSEPDVIKRYQHGSLVCEDVTKEMARMKTIPIAKSTGKHAQKTKPEKKTFFETPCPQSQQGGGDGKCPSKKVEWKCAQCFDILEYGFDNYLYCSCGAARVEDFFFRCNNDSHGDRFSSLKPEAVEDLCNNLKSFNGLTILMLGETGVGKSTFINGFANYMQFSSLGEAKNAQELLTPVKDTLDIVNDNFVVKTISPGKKGNMCQATGWSATQRTRAYVFNYKGAVNVRLIDTPGIGDIRGPEKDKENFQNILAHLSYYNEIHGICILLKPNNSRLTVMFQFCIKELLTRLHKSAADNIIFCFTNARNTNYRPGHSFPSLKSLLKENKSVSIELNEDTVYCMDNEAFRYLAACNAGILFPEDKEFLFEISWDHSRAEMERLMNYLRSRTPFEVRDAVSINGVRQKIMNLTSSFAEMAWNVDENVIELEKQRTELEDLCSVDEIQKRMDLTALKRRELSHPRTVCTSECPGPNVVCHQPCFLQDSKTWLQITPGLRCCWAFSIRCDACRCSWWTHLHVTHEFIQVPNAALDQAAQECFQGIQKGTGWRKKVIAELGQLIRELRNEKAEIIKASAIFGLFLKENSIIPYYDAMIAYHKHQLKMGRKGRSGLPFGHSTLHSYRFQSQLLETMEKDGNGAPRLEASDMYETLEHLFALRHSGQNLKELLMSAEESQRVRMAKEESHTKLKNLSSSRKPSLGDKFWSFVVSVLSSPEAPEDMSETVGLDEEDVGKSCVIFCLG